VISIQQLGFHFGGRYLYSDVNWQIYDGQRIGLVGPNGAGKSTLLRVISGEYTPSEGQINKSNDCTIGFLNQDLLSIEYEQSIYDVAKEAFQEALMLEKELNSLYEAMALDYSDDMMEKVGKVQERFEALDGYNIKHKTEEVLEGLGFKTADLQKPFSSFSGGWRMRVLLAKILLQQPRLLLLDEPTNHLDLPSIEWLEQYLQGYKGAVVVVSHDRFFLDKMINTTAEIAYGKLTVYPGNYSFFLEAKQERDDLQQRQFENQQQYIKQQERFIERFKAKASKATQAQSKLKMLEKMERIDAVETGSSQINIKFNVLKKSGKVLNTFSDLSKSYGDLTVLNRISGAINRGDRIALIGANGKGKTTLLKVIAGETAYEGNMEIGYQVIQSFYAQHQLEALDLKNDILSELDKLGTGKTENELRTILGCFLFTGDDVFKKVKVLSGGEKARVALAKCLVVEANFLLLDEPTNHLDMQSIDILVQSLNQFEGTVVFVSHDRHFIERVATKIWWIEDGQLKEYPGNYQEYKYWQEHHQPIKSELQKKSNQSPTSIKSSISPSPDPLLKNSKSEQKKIEKELEQLEQDMHHLEKEKNTIEEWMSVPENVINTEPLKQKHSELNNLDQKLRIIKLKHDELFETLLTLQEKDPV
jgi:ATP-binding cassette, subfamily F, member 3